MKNATVVIDFCNGFSPQNMAVSDAIQKVAASFKCSAVEGILCHQLKRNSYESEKTIILNPTDQQQ